MKLTQAQIDQIERLCSMEGRGYGSGEAEERKNRGGPKRNRRGSKRTRK